jgi:hypothetical protein
MYPKKDDSGQLAPHGNQASGESSKRGRLPWMAVQVIQASIQIPNDLVRDVKGDELL